MIEHIIHISECSLRAKCGQGPNLQRRVEVSKQQAIDSLRVDVTHPHLITLTNFNLLLCLDYPFPW